MTKRDFDELLANAGAIRCKILEMMDMAEIQETVPQNTQMIQKNADFNAILETQNAATNALSAIYNKKIEPDSSIFAVVIFYLISSVCKSFT